MTVQVLWHGETRGRGSEWGLDLAFVRLHRPDDVERIKAHKSAVNLLRHRIEFLSSHSPQIGHARSLAWWASGLIPSLELLGYKPFLAEHPVSPRT
jgi:hypothetical protein